MTAPTVLQWGRDLSAAESTRLVFLWAVHYRLQWGRDLSAAERHARISYHHRFISFNGAATFRPRRVSYHELESARPDMLQWGRDLSAAESAALAVSMDGATKRFNGAATFRPRRAFDFQVGDVLTWLLQWGRDLSAAESLRSSRCLMRPIRLQWGRDLSAAERPGRPGLAERNRPASMGPRPFGRGEGRGCVGSIIKGMASMGPRPFGRGESTSRRNPTATSRLPPYATGFRPRREHVPPQSVLPL